MSHYDVIEGPEHVPIKGWTRGVPIEDAALRYLEKVCAKLRVRTRIEAVAVAVRTGLIDPD